MAKEPPVRGAKEEGDPKKESLEDALRREKEKGPLKAPPDPLIGEHIANC